MAAVPQRACEAVDISLEMNTEKTEGRFIDLPAGILRHDFQHRHCIIYCTHRMPSFLIRFCFEFFDIKIIQGMNLKYKSFSLCILYDSILTKICQSDMLGTARKQ